MARSCPGRAGRCAGRPPERAADGAQVGSYNSGILQFITVLRHKLRGRSRTTYVDSCERQYDWVTSVQKALSPDWDTAA
jgi:hypothetical protein